MQGSVEKAKSFLVTKALPFWSSTGFYGNGCFVEHLDLEGRPVDPGFTRVRVQARQLYVFSHAEATGLFHQPGLTDQAAEFFITSAWQGPDRGFAKVISRNGQVLDGSTDLYDVSFALFALAWRFKVARDPRCLEIAHQTLDFIDRNLRHPAGGYANDDARSRPRQQNPHMHLTEAMVAWADASGESRFLDKASEIIDLYSTRFTDPETGALGEFFNEDWTIAPGATGQIVEPGHQFEWTWIIAQHGRLSGTIQHDLMRRVMAFGLRHGFDAETGLTIDQIDRSGAVVAASRRLWPQTEAIKAAIAAAEYLDDHQPDRLARIVDALFAHYLDRGPVPGTWLEHFDSNGQLLVQKVPTSSLYHVALAFFELIRFAKAAG